MSGSPEAARWRRYRWAVVVLWSIFLLALLARALVQPTRNSVYPIFARAGELWRAGGNLYGAAPAGSGLDEFRYPPPVAALLAPFSRLPLMLGGIVWRCLSVVVFFAGFTAFLRTVYPGNNALDTRAAAWLWLLLLPLSVPSLNNGQTNPLLLGLLLLGLSAVAREHWWLAAFLLSLPIVFKLYPLALTLLLLLIYPRQLGGRLAVCLVAALLLPFALQDRSYVAEQYASWLNYLATDDREGRSFVGSYRDIRLLLRLVGIPLSSGAYQILQIAVAFGLAIVIWHERRWPVAELLPGALHLACCWMTLFGPATESCTYTLLAPTLALAGWQATQPGRSVWTRGGLIAIVALFLASVAATALPGGKAYAFFLNPLAALLLLVERLCTLNGYRVAIGVTDDGPEEPGEHCGPRLPGGRGAAPFSPGTRPCARHA